MKVQNAIIGVIGFGNFGKVVCNNLFANNPIILFSQKNLNDLPKNLVLANSLKELVEKSDIIIPCVPIRNFEEVIKSIAPIINKETVVMDVCSIKKYPVEIMKKHLPKMTQIIATHPMFGPNSIKKRKDSLKDLVMVMQNISADPKTYEGIKMHIKYLKIQPLEMSPNQHDEFSAKSHFFALTIGEMGQKLHLHPTPIDTPGARVIFDALQYMGADRHIIEDMMRYNPYCKNVLETMVAVLSSLRKGKMYA